MSDAPASPLGLVGQLRQFDPALRLRWARHQACWLIELHVPEQLPAWRQERPNPFGSSPRAKDEWEGWKDGYLYVTKLSHPIEYPWDFIAAHLTHLTLRAHHAKTALLERLEAAEAEAEAAAKRDFATQGEAAAKELYDRLAWDQGRRVSLQQPGENPLLEAREGFVVRDRRVAV